MDNRYFLNQNDIITEIAGSWDDFALQNGGRDARASKLIGNSIWQYIKGDETQAYMNAIFFSVRRSHQPFIASYCCDSKTESREYEMSVTLIHGEILVSHRLIHSRSFFPSDKYFAANDILVEKRCSMCCRFEIDNSWIHLIATSTTDAITNNYGICPDCREEFVKATDGELLVQRKKLAQL